MFRRLSAAQRYRVYYYAQLDSTNSDKPDDPRLWTIERYVEEVEAVGQGLGLDNFFLFGHSWGGILAIKYALKYQQHLKDLVISNMSASILSYLKRIDTIRSKFPPDVLAKLESFEKQEKRMIQNKVFICRLDPCPDPLLRVFAGLNPHMYNTMQRSSPKGWDRWADLPKIKVPTLTMGAQYDKWIRRTCVRWLR